MLEQQLRDQMSLVGQRLGRLWLWRRLTWCWIGFAVLTLAWFGLGRPVDYLLGVLVGAAALTATGLSLLVSRYLELPNISLVFLAAVLLVAVRSSLGPALACAGLSFLTYNFFFIPPTWSLTIARQQDVLTLLFFLLMPYFPGNSMAFWLWSAAICLGIGLLHLAGLVQSWGALAGSPGLR